MMILKNNFGDTNILYLILPNMHSLLLENCKATSFNKTKNKEQERDK